MRHFFSSLFAGVPAEQHIPFKSLASFAQNCRTQQTRSFAGSAIKRKSLTEVIAAVAVAARRELGLELFDVQLQGALALANGRIAEMQTGEGKNAGPLFPQWCGWQRPARAST